MTYFEALVLAIVEGLTEFLPVSSTGHMIIASSFMGIASDSFVKTYTVAIQLGAILSVLVLYFKRFFQDFNLYIKLAIAFIPAAVLGFLLNDFIDALLENVTVVATMLILGGVFLVFVDRIFSNEHSEQEVKPRSAFFIGLFQCLAMIPGVSRSAASIIGGMAQGLSRKTAAEFSFFLAVPTMFAATGYKLLKSYKLIGSEEISVLLFGNIIAFLVGLLAIRFFIQFLTKKGFAFFGYYRILVGTALLLLQMLGYQLEII